MRVHERAPFRQRWDELDISQDEIGAYVGDIQKVLNRSWSSWAKEFSSRRDELKPLFPNFDWEQGPEKINHHLDLITRTISQEFLLAFSISELKKVLLLPKFALIEHGVTLAGIMPVDYKREKQNEFDLIAHILYNLQFIGGLTKLLDSPDAEETALAKAWIRFATFHEIGHAYQITHYPNAHSTQQLIVANYEHWQGMSKAYAEDRGEIFANLFAIGALMAIPAESQMEQLVNKQMAEFHFGEMAQRSLKQDGSPANKAHWRQRLHDFLSKNAARYNP